MARIRQYTAEGSVQGVIPSRAAVAADFGGEGPAALGEDVNRAAAVIEDGVIRDDVATVRANMAKARAEWTANLQQRLEKAQPGDETFAAKYGAELSDYLGKARESARTRHGLQVFDTLAADLAGDLTLRANGAQATLAGKKAVLDYNVLLDANRNTLVSDPTQFGKILQQTTAALNDPAGPYARMSPAERQALEVQMKKQLALSAVQGLIQNGAPELAKRHLADGKMDAYLDADNKAALMHNAEVAIRAKDVEAERQRLVAERERKDRAEATMSAFLARIVDPKANGGSLTDREVLAAPDLTAAQKEHVVEYRLRRAREMAALAEVRTNPGEVRRLMLDIHANPDDPRKVYNTDNVMESYRTGKISTNEMVFLRREVEQLRDGNTGGFQKDVQNARNAVYTALTRSIMGQTQPEKAADAAYRFNVDLQNAIEVKRKNNEDPRTLLTPGHKDYMLSPERISSYLGDAASGVRSEAVRTVEGKIGGGPSKPVVPASTGGLPTAVNPKTGETMVFKDGKWQKP